MKTLELTKWFDSNQRDLPWRRSKSPYLIWISEVMLQQTTVAAVRPYYDKFILLFPNLKSLAEASIEDVLEAWSGLGYYSRARNLKAAAEKLATIPFPENHQELLKLPGFGPYTSRAVSSIAFNERVGVVDGNVIRVMSRYLNWPVEHWTPVGRLALQNKIDNWIQEADSSMNSGTFNQAIMELGATLCTPKSPACLLCPVLSSCKGQKAKNLTNLPLKKPKRKSEHWELLVIKSIDKQKIALVKNDYAPFLKGQWFFPGQVKRVKSRPKKFDLKHGITHHDIYVQIKDETRARISKRFQNNSPELKWIEIKEVKKWSPSSLVIKVLEHKFDR